MVKLLLSAGAEPNLQGCCGDTPLFWATTRGRMDIVQLLLDAGAEPKLAHKEDTHRELAETIINLAVLQEQLLWYRPYGPSYIT